MANLYGISTTLRAILYAYHQMGIPRIRAIFDLMQISNVALMTHTQAHKLHFNQLNWKVTPNNAHQSKVIMRERTLSELNSRKVEKKTENKNKNLHMPNGKQVENG